MSANTSSIQVSDNFSPLSRLAKALNVDPDSLKKTIVKMVFGGTLPSNEEFLTILMIAEKLDLNPLAGELWAFKSKNGTVQPIVSVDGWSRIMNRQPSFDGYEIRFSDKTVRINDQDMPEWAECTIFRKDRSHPTTERIWAAEKYVASSPVWKHSPRLMLRHRAMIQCIRFAFGVSGIGDENDMGLIESQVVEPPVKTSRRIAASELNAPAANADGNAETVHKSLPGPDFTRIVGTIIDRAREKGCWEEACEYVRTRMSPTQANLALARIAQARSEAGAQVPGGSAAVSMEPAEAA